MPPDPSAEARIWLAQAAEDLAAAGHLAANPDMPPHLTLAAADRIVAALTRRVGR